MDLIDIYWTFHPKTTEYTFFSTAHRIFSRIDLILVHKSSLGKFKKTEIVSSVLSNHQAMRLEINYRKKICKKYKHRVFPGGAVVENLPANSGDTGSSPGLGRFHMPPSK